MHLVYLFLITIPGLPKAAIVTHARFARAASLMLLGGMTTDDILYTPLPLYHSAAGMLGMGAVILVGKLNREFTTLDLRLVKHRKPIARMKEYILRRCLISEAMVRNSKR